MRGRGGQLTTIRTTRYGHEGVLVSDSFDAGDDGSLGGVDEKVSGIEERSAWSELTVPEPKISFSVPFFEASTISGTGYHRSMGQPPAKHKRQRERE